MKKILFMIAVAAMAAISCDNLSNGVKTADVAVSLELDGEVYAEAGKTITLKDLNSTAVYNALTDSTGTAVFSVLPGLYEASATFRTLISLYNGLTSNISVIEGAENKAKIALKASKSSTILIKELYNGGCPKDDASGVYTQDRYVILYNNTSEAVDASNICFGFIGSNSNAAAVMKTLIDADGNLAYEPEGQIPAMHGVWWFQNPVTIEPYSQIVVSICGAINHTQTYSNSVNLANPAYYTMYDTESGYNQAAMYPAPSEVIPTSNYLKATKYGAGTGWTLSTTSPAFFIFNKAGIHDYANDPGNRDTRGSFEGAKILFDWLVDGVEVFVRGADDKNTKRLSANIDAGNVQHTNKLGYSIYRNVDKAATEAIAENAGKLVYNYAGGTKDIDVEGGTTDPSGIDAEKSIANGAKIVYMDTNNSTNDFHERVYASLTGK